MAKNSGPMGQKTPQQNEDSGIQHPYKKFESSQQWQILSDSIDALVKNGDLLETTSRMYIVGYLCQQLSDIKEGTEQGMWRGDES